MQHPILLADLELYYDKTNVNSSCDVTNLDHIGSVKVQDV